MPIEFTKQQQNAIDSRGKVLVSAAAGSGKTAVLVERAVRLICDRENPVDADRLLIVTFTNAAASEMRERIAKRLFELSKSDPANARLSRQRILIRKASIGTMDSFCKALVKEYFFKADLPPDFTLAQNGVIANIKSSAMKTVLQNEFEQNSEDFLLLCRCFGNSVFKLKGAIENIYIYTRSIPFVDEFFQMTDGLYENFSQKSDWYKAVFSREKEKAYIKNRIHILLLNILRY